MSPDEISTCNVTTSPFYDSTSREKLALLEALRPFKSRRSVVLRAISPLTPWSDDEAKPKTRRKNLHKTKAQGKLKNGLATKENAKGRKDLREYVRSCQRKNDQLPSEDKHVARGWWWKMLAERCLCSFVCHVRVFTQFFSNLLSTPRTLRKDLRGTRSRNSAKSAVTEIDPVGWVWNYVFAQANSAQTLFRLSTQFFVVMFWK